MSNINLSQQMKTLSKGRELDAYTGVIIHVGQDNNGNEISYSSGDNSGYVLEVTSPIGTQIMADSILAGLKLRGVRYQPFESDSSMLDPSAEIGDGVTVNGTDSVILSQNTRHGRLMASDISAPYDEEVDHEFKYEPKQVREFKRESAYTRARITLTNEQIQLEVARATEAEGTLSSRITINADAITSEVTRATDAEGTLGTRIDQRLDSITLSVTSATGSSTFTLKDGSTTLDTKTLDLTVKAVNIDGKLTVGQIADGTVVISSKSETEYYLSTSSSSATGGSWSTTVPTWASGKYIWTRTKTTDTKNDNTTSSTYSPSANGAYDKNLTEALSTAAGASSAASGAQTSANSATKRTQLIYRSTSGGSVPSAPSAWVSDVTGGQNVWTALRPEYSSSYPALYIARQTETVGGTLTTSTPAIDATTTVIDGAHIITGTIDASKIAVTDLSALNATIGGWKINSKEIRKTVTNTYDTALCAPSSPAAADYVIYARKYVNNVWEQQFWVTYGGAMYAKNATIEGNITATSGTIGGVTISNGVLSGIKDQNIQAGGISGGSGGSIGQSTLTTWNTESGINTNLGYANAFGTSGLNGSTVQDTQYYPAYFACGNLRVHTAIQSDGGVSGTNGVFSGNVYVNGTRAYWKSVTIGGSTFKVLANVS